MEPVEGQIIEEQEINTKKCKNCKKITKMSKSEIAVALLGTYVLFSSIYGTIEIIGKIKDLFN
jgi:hypothetical protein